VETELAPTPAADSFVVISVSGQVERKFTGQEQWEKVLEGMQLRRDDAIKTGEHSRVKLSVNDKSEIELDRLSEISVGEIAEAVHRLKLVSGKIKVDYDEDAERVLTISVKKSGAFVQTKAGRFDMQNTDQIVSVAATRGIVKLTAQEKSVAIPPGTVSRVLPGQAPSQTEPLPVSVMLRVAKLQRRVQTARAATVRGQTDVGARVEINSVPIRVGENGKFKVNVPLELGKNVIVVVAEDVAGNSRIKALPSIKVVPPPSSKVTETKIRWGK
jgi:hypothetical protein